MVKEKLLVKKEKQGLFERIKSFFKRMFRKNEDEFTNVDLQAYSKNNFIEDLKNDNKMLELQQKFERGLVKESELTEMEKAELAKLYREQIKTLEFNIQNYKRDLQYYEQKIILNKNNLNESGK